MSPSCIPRAPRRSASARIDLEDRALAVCTAHLDPSSAARRGEQLRAMLARLRAHAGAAGAIVGGDLNATPDSDAIAQVRASLRSAYASVHGREPAHTTPTPFGAARRREGRSVAFAALD